LHGHDRRQAQVFTKYGLKRVFEKRDEPTLNRQ
jgi:hypothetical protein